MSTRTPMPRPADEAPVIEVSHLTKEYRLGAMQGLRATVRRLLGRGGASQAQGFKALDDVSFSVRRGEVVGIIGHNGAGKSTLLKHLCRITTPSSGSVTVRGRVAPLIEVGAGLVGDMTGRENIYLNASILGLSQSEIDSKVDEIIAFAELEKFIDTPIKRYSSGMQVRLGYAIATAVDCEILIVDEVLAVGDLQFQRKSIERMQRLISESQKTVLIVGHNIRQMERICTRMILLDHGKVLMDGGPVEVANKFFDLATLSGKSGMLQETGGRAASTLGRFESSGDLTVHSIRLLHDDGTASDQFHVGDPITAELDVHALKPLKAVDMAIAIHTPDLMNIGISPLTASLPDEISLSEGFNRIRCRFGRTGILPGLFMLKIGIKDQWGQMMWHCENASPFHITPPPGASHARYSAITFIQMEASWTVKQSEADQAA
ncbi:MAG: ATP-binding cassette domain-containing protein [Burkholderiaceae bacterium]|nr:ATP-binding cassette domain-containing protein [Burkholderiaceae bacterium]